MTAPIASGWSGCRMGFAPTGKRRLCTAHTQPGHSSTDSFWRIVLKKSFFADCGEGRPESANCPVFLWRRAGVNWPRPLCRPLDRCRPGALSNAVPACGVALISSSGPATRTQSMCQCEQCGRNYADHRPKGLSCISGAADGGLFRCLLRGGYKAGRVLLRWAPPYLFAANT